MTNYKDQVIRLKLGHLYDLCYRAHSNTSFYPEKRAVSIIQSYSALLQSDLAELGEKTGNYENKFIQYFTNWMSAKSNTISSMITGPSNFPVNRAMKANNREQAAYEEFDRFRDRYFTSVNRVPQKTPEDDLTDTENRLEKLIAFQDQAKEVNVFLRKTKLKDLQEMIAELLDQGYPKEVLKRIDKVGDRYKVPAYALTNNNATIKRLRERIQILGTRIERKENFEDLLFDGGYITISDDRVKVFHEDKPSADIINKLKRGGFRWSPFWKCWTRKHTGNAIKDAMIIVGYQKPKIEVSSIVEESQRTRNIRILKLKYKYQ
jgi:hypothetical protein